MTTIRRLAYLAFGVACAHLVFGAIVRISGSGMGCGDHWPRCYGRWFPPLSRSSNCSSGNVSGFLHIEKKQMKAIRNVMTVILFI